MGITSTTEGDSLGQAFFDRSRGVRLHNARPIGAESWLFGKQGTCGYVVRGVWIPRGSRLASDDLERIAIVDSIFCQQPSNYVATRQLRKRARIPKLWMRFRELGLRVRDYSYAKNRRIYIAEHHQSSHRSECEVPEDAYGQDNKNKRKSRCLRSSGSLGFKCGS